LILFIVTLISCFLFDLVDILKSTEELISSYKELPSILTDEALSDDQRQSKLLKSSSFQIKNLAILCFKIVVSLLPFSSLYLLEFDLTLLFELKYILISLAGVISYVVLKKLYEKTLQDK